MACHCVIFMAAVVAASSAKCTPTKDSSCPSEGPRGGGAMIQAGASASSQAAPLKGRLVTLEAEVAGLEGRIGALKTEVGATAGAAPEAPALLEKDHIEERTALFADYASLLRDHSDLGSLASTTSDLEAKMAAVLSDIQQLHNQVSGNAFSAPSLLSTYATKVARQRAVRSRVVSSPWSMKSGMLAPRSQP